MIGLVLVTHGRLAAEFVTAMEHVVGPQQAVEAICIGPEDDMEARRDEIAAAIARVDDGDGVILLTWLLPDENIAQIARRMPVVTMSRLTTMAGVAMVTPDQVGSTVDAVEHLLSLGHRKIVMVTVPPGTLQGWQHREGLRVGMRHAPDAQSRVLTAQRNMTDEWVPEFRELLARPDTLRRMSDAAMDLVDGCGAERVANTVMDAR